jgi:hypothetical protein
MERRFLSAIDQPRLIPPRRGFFTSVAPLFAQWRRNRSHCLFQKKIGLALSIFLVIENGLKVTLPAPAPVDCDPPLT